MKDHIGHRTWAACRRVAFTAGVAVVAAAGWDLAGLRPAGAQAPAASMTVSELVLVDGSGKTVATLSAGKEGAGLTFVDAQGSPRLALQVGSDDAAGLTVFDASGKPAVRLGVQAKGARGVVLSGDDGTDRASLFSDPGEDHSGLILSSSEIPRQIELACMGTGDAGLSINTGDGASVIAAGTGPKGTGISLRDAQGNERFNVGLNATSTPALAVKDPNGKLVWSAP